MAIIPPAFFGRENDLEENGHNTTCSLWFSEKKGLHTTCNLGTSVNHLMSTPDPKGTTSCPPLTLRVPKVLHADFRKRTTIIPGAPDGPK